MAIVAKEQRVTSLDHLSKMSPEMSVALARMSTGSTIANRGLYTDGEVAAFSVKEWKGQANELLNIARMAAQDLGMSMEFPDIAPRDG